MKRWIKTTDEKLALSIDGNILALITEKENSIEIMGNMSYRLQPGPIEQSMNFAEKKITEISLAVLTEMTR